MGTLSIKAFDLVYKRLGPTGSTGTPSVWSGNLPEFWFTRSINFPVSTLTASISGAFLNFPPYSPGDATGPGTFASTRQSASNATYKALPWGSTATDFLWNVSTPSWSFAENSYSYGGSTYIMREWSVSTTFTGSFCKTYYYPRTSNGVMAYPVTTSWYIADPKFQGATNYLYYVHRRNGLLQYPTYVGSYYTTTQPEWSSLVSYDITWPALQANSTSSIDGQYFDLGGGAAITRAAISRSFVTQSVSGSASGTVSIRHYTEALKARRLFFPIPVTSSGADTGTDYFFKLFTGYQANEIFTDNGGIYNVQLSLKRKVSTDNYPDTGSHMSVFIHNVHSTAPNPGARLAGTSGWYPPDNNIVKIGHGYLGGPLMSFYDVQTGYQLEKFNFNLIQYGYPAQLCIEASGSLADDKYFGIIVDDIQICKIGVTTDPRFIKPTTVAQTVQDTGLYQESVVYNPGDGGGGFA